MAIITKTTIGFVTQYWDTTIGKWVNQEFVAGDQVDYEDESGNNINDEDIVLQLPYLSLEMVQPDEHGSEKHPNLISKQLDIPVDEILGADDEG